MYGWERFAHYFGLNKNGAEFFPIFFVGLMLLGALVAALVVVVTHG